MDNVDNINNFHTIDTVDNVDNFDYVDSVDTVDTVDIAIDHNIYWLCCSKTKFLSDSEVILQSESVNLPTITYIQILQYGSKRR